MTSRWTLSATALVVAALGLVSTGIALEKPYGSLEGRVVDAETRRPIAGAWVYAHPQQHRDEGDHAVTDEQGHFRLARLPVGGVSLAAMARGYLETHRDSSETVVAEGQTVTAKDVALRPVPDSIRLHASRIPQASGKGAELTCAGRLRKSDSVEFEVYHFDIVAWAKTREHYWSWPEPDKAEGPPVKAWTHRLARQERDGRFRETVKLADLPPGGYLVVAKSGKTADSWPLLITDIALVVKHSPSQIVAYVTGFADGRPRPGVTVGVGSREGGGRGVTDERGLFTCQGQFQERVVVVARDSGSAAWTRSWSWDGTKEHRVFTYTDRPLYRPGHLVHVKGIVRKMQDRDYATYGRRPVRVNVRSPRGSDVLTQTMLTNAFGTYHLTFQLSPEAELGYYSIATRVEEEEHSAGFQVEEYRKPEYEVTVTPKEPVYVGEGEMEATVEAQYYFGAPVTDANVSYSVYANPYRAWDIEGYWEGEEYYGYGEWWTSGEATTDETGVAHIRVPFKDLESAQEVVIEAEVTDAAGRAIRGRGKCLAAPSAVLVRVVPDRWFYEAGEPAKLEITVTDYQGQGQADKTVEVRVQALDWVRIAGKWQEKATPVHTLGAVTDSEGRAQVTFEVPEGGDMRVTVVTADSAGREARGEVHVWLAGGYGDYYQAEARRWTLSVVPEKQAYQPGETAKVLVSSSAKGGVALLTVEGEKVYDMRLVDLAAGPRTAEVPLRINYAPEIRISACLVSEERYGEDYKRVKVSPKSRYLTVKVSSDREKYQPGERASYEVSVSDEQGRPVNAEVSLGVVDESVYAVSPDSADIRSAFYGSAPVHVQTQHSFPEEYYAGAGDKGEGDGVEMAVRKYFPDTALWAPTLLTGRDGVARISLPLPDSLTTWRATARAITRETQVGSGRGKIICQRPLVARLVVPRFFTQGDELEIAGLVHNYTDQAQTVDVSLEAAGLKVTTAASQQVDIGEQGVKRCAWQVRAPKPGTATLTLRAKGATASDALELSLPVLPFGVEKVVAQIGTAASVVPVPLDLPSEAIPETVDLRVDLTPTPAHACFGSLDYLVGFPYGCVEQTMSRFLPDVLLKRLLQRLGLELRRAGEKLEEAIRQGLERLYRMQGSDGGWGWWEYDESSPHMTAYVLYGLAHTRAAGYEVDDEVLSEACRFLRSRFERVKATRDRAYALRSLALLEQAPREALAECYEQRGDMDGYTLALTANAVGQSSGTWRDAVGALPVVMNALRKQRQKEAGAHYWTSKARQYSWLDSPIEATAEASKALVRHGGGPDEARPAIRWLLHARTGDHWRSTKESALAISAIGEYVEQMQITRPPSYTATVTLNDAELHRYRVTRANMFKQIEPVRADVAQFRLGQSNTLTVGKEGAGEMDFTVLLRYFLKAEQIAAEDQGIEVQRRYFLMVPKKGRKGKRVEYEERPFDGALKKGQQLRCKVTVKPSRPCDYVVLEVPRPAGCEVIEQPPGHQYWEWESDWGYYSQREERDEKTVFFVNNLESSQAFTFDMRAEIAGTYNVLPASAAGMYHPEVRGNSAGARVVIEEK